MAAVFLPNKNYLESLKKIDNCLHIDKKKECLRDFFWGWNLILPFNLANTSIRSSY